MRALDTDEVRRRVSAARVGRLATVRPDGRPHLVPICFAVVGDTIVSTIDDKPKVTTDLQRLKNIAGNPNVTLLVDYYDEDWARVWWARVDGTARIVEHGDERDTVVAALQGKYDQYDVIGISGPAVVIDATDWRGWAYSD